MQPQSQIGIRLDTATEHNKVWCFNQLFIQYFNDHSAWGDQRLGSSSTAFAHKTSLCTLMWFTNKCTYLKHNSLPGLHVGALKPLVLEAYTEVTDMCMCTCAYAFMVWSAAMYSYYVECHLNIRRPQVTFSDPSYTLSYI